jgi:ribokinase
MLQVKIRLCRSRGYDCSRDTFIGAFAAAHEAGQGAKEALRFASAAAAISVTRAGAQTSIPNKEEVLCFLSKYDRK